jgi:hypothetical protein
MSPSDFLSRLGLPTEFPAFFPPQLEQYRRSLAEAADTPDEFAVAQMLAVAATAAGGDVSASVQPGWYVRCNLFLAIISFKGTGKSTIADKANGPLIQREAELCEEAAQSMQEGLDGDDEDEDEDEDGSWSTGEYEDGDEDDEDGGRRSPRRRHVSSSTPCVVVNDVTGPALLQLLGDNRRQLLVHADELSALFIRNTGGTDRAMWCELHDGRRRRRARASSQSGSTTLTAPYVNVVGSIQPALVKLFYNNRGDDGLLDRLLLVGDGVAREAQWPKDADDPILNVAWSTAMERLLRIEHLAADAIGEQIESRFTAEALDVCKSLMGRLNNLAVVIGVPEAQRGIVKKLVQHAVKLALLHRVLRWAAGEFGDNGPLGDVEPQDAIAARDATLFFLGRWLVWRGELWGRGPTVLTGPLGLAQAPGDDPVLQSLATAAAGAQRGISIIERLVRLMRARGSQPVVLATLTAEQILPDVPLDELRSACGWMVDNGHATWLDADRRGIRLVQPAAQVECRQRGMISAAKERAR